MLFSIIMSLSSTLAAIASAVPRDNGGGGGEDWSDASLIVTFGDSYTDDCNAWRDQGSSRNQSQYPFPKCPRKYHNGQICEVLRSLLTE